MKRIAILALAAAAALASGAALAHGRITFGIGIGVPIWGAPFYPYGYYPPYYYEPRTVVVPAQPTRYIEQASPESGYWYYCADAKAYYPYVKDCPGGWQRVSPTPR
jgi:hypothetical protein